MTGRYARFSHQKKFFKEWFGMRRCWMVFATAAMVLAVMCDAAWAANYSMNIDHNTISFLTRDYKAEYGGGTTRFGFINCRHIYDESSGMLSLLDPSTFTNGSISITPKQPVTINYAGDIIQGVSYEGRLNSVLGTETLSAAKTFQFKKDTRGIGLYPVNDKGWHPIFVDGAEDALLQAAYSINVDGNVSNKTFDKFLTTAEQIATKYVPYVELKIDATGRYAEGITWRPVDAKDPSKPAPNDPNDPRYEGLWGNYSKYSPSPRFYLRVKLYLKDGTGGWGKVFSSSTPDVSDLSGSETFKTPIALSDIACITFDDDSHWYWIFYPYRPNAAGGGTSTTIDPSAVTGTATVGSTIGDVTCHDGDRPIPSDLVNNNKSAIAGSATITNFTVIRTISVSVSYARRDISQGGEVTITIPGFLYPNPKGKLYALVKPVIGGMYQRFAIKQDASGIRFNIPIIGYFADSGTSGSDVAAMALSPSYISIADIEETGNNNNGGSGSGGCVTGAALFAVAAVALMKRKK